jgi:hypothetical protein
MPFSHSQAMHINCLTIFTHNLLSRKCVSRLHNNGR